MRFGCCYNVIRALIVFPSQKLIYRHKYLMMKLVYKAILIYTIHRLDCKHKRRGTVLLFMSQYGSSKITVFVWGKNTILKFLARSLLWPRAFVSSEQ